MAMEIGRTDRFRALCAEKGLSLTHQRQIIWDALMSMHDHPSPEAIYEKVRAEIPSISLATVYKNVKTFMEHDMLREVSLHHGSARIETNLHPHHHMVCRECKAISDLEDGELEPVRLRGRPPDGFRVERYSVEVLGICKRCSQQQSS